MIRYQGTKTKCVRILTTQGNAEPVDVQIRRKVDDEWQEVTIQKPKIIAEKYNFNKANVDVVDQLMSYNSVIRKNRSFAYKLVMLSIDVVLTNGHALWKHYTQPPAHKAYGRCCRRLLVDQLVAEANAVAPRGIPQHKRKHKQALLPDGKRKRCKVCLQDGKKDSRSRYYCEVCADQPALCVLHFAEYHEY